MLCVLLSRLPLRPPGAKPRVARFLATLLPFAQRYLARALSLRKVARFFVLLSINYCSPQSHADASHVNTHSAPSPLTVRIGSRSTFVGQLPAADSAAVRFYGLTQ